MSSHPEVIRVYTIIDIDIGLIHAAKNECDGLDLNTTASSKVFQPGDKCVEIIDSVKKHSPRTVQARSVIVFLPGATTEYLQSPCLVIPIEKDGLPTRMTTRDKKIVTVDWDQGRAWEVLGDVRLAAVDKKGGTLLVLRV